MTTYGPDFAAIYNDDWAFYADKFWPVLAKAVQRYSPSARSWLDLCCGCGSMLRPICRAGFEAAGLDASPHQLRFAARNAPQARLTEGDIRDFDLQGRFDVITCMFDSINYLTSAAELAEAMACVRRHLAEGGLFVFDLNTTVGLKEYWQDTIFVDKPAYTYTKQLSFDAAQGQGRAVIIGFVKDGRCYRKFREEHLEQGYGRRQIDGLLRKAGFRFDCRDGHNLRRACRKSSRLIYFCQLDA